MFPKIEISSKARIYTLMDLIDQKRQNAPNSIQQLKKIKDFLQQGTHQISRPQEFSPFSRLARNATLQNITNFPLPIVLRGQTSIHLPIQMSKKNRYIFQKNNRKEKYKENAIKNKSLAVFQRSKMNRIVTQHKPELKSVIYQQKKSLQKNKFKAMLKDVVGFKRFNNFQQKINKTLNSSQFK